MVLYQVGMANVIAPTRNSPERNLKYLETKSDGAVGTIVFNHPEKRNALSSPLIKSVVETLDEFARERIRAVVLRAQPDHNDYPSINGHETNQ
jgi:hypothetical protein